MKGAAMGVMLERYWAVPLDFWMVGYLVFELVDRMGNKSVYWKAGMLVNKLVDKTAEL